MGHQPKVSIILPSLNVASYIRECLESVTRQTLKDIEIICVDSGSTDGTLEVIREFEAKDPRVKVIVSDKKSYGRQMNLGFDAATGEYLGIVETDDWVVPNMYEKLYKIAKRNQLDFVKADFYRFTVNPDGSLDKTYNQLARDKSFYGRVLVPGDEPETFKFIMNTWSGIYDMEFLRRWNIRHNETPGASYQDNGFWFQTFCRAQRAMFINTPFYMNRRDNPNSSVYSTSKVYCMRDEYDYLRSIIDSDPSLARFVPLCEYFRFCGYYYNTVRRISPELRRGFLEDFTKEFRALADANELDRSLFSNREWDDLQQIMFFSEQYLATNLKECLPFKLREAYRAYQDVDVPGPEVSVIIPVYNVEAYLRDCLDSVLAQTFADFEVLCVNDGSTDASLAILNEYAERDARVKVFSQHNGGPSRARNYGLSQATGTYICFVDADDGLAPNALQRFVETAKRHRSDVVICGLKIDHYPVEGELPLWIKGKNPKRNKVYKSFEPRVLFEEPGAKPFAQRDFVRRSFLAENDIWFSEDCWLGEDTIFQFEMLPKARNIAFIKDELSYYRSARPGSLMAGGYENAAQKTGLHVQVIAHLATVWQCEGLLNAMRIPFAEWAVDFFYNQFDECPEQDKPGLGNDFIAVLRRFLSESQQKKLGPGRQERIAAILEYCEPGERRESEEPPTSPCTPCEGDAARESVCHPIAESPLVSIIVPAHNAQEYLERTLESLLGQTLESIEVICIDDASTDQTPDILRSYQKRDGRLSVITYPENRTANQARKDGVAQARGSYILFCDADDTYEPDACEKLCAAMKEQPVDILHFGTNVVCEDAFEEDRRWVEANTIPYYGILRGQDVFTGCFRGKVFGFNLWNKMYNATMAKQAFSHVEDGCFPRGQDVYAFSLLAYFAESYRGIGGAKYYNYHLGAGMDGTKDIEPEKFVSFCAFSLVSDALERFFVSQGVFDTYADIWVDMRARLIGDCINKWHKKVADSKKAVAFDAMSEYWPSWLVAEGIARRYWDCPDKLMGALRGSRIEHVCSPNPRTIGMYYHKQVGGGVEKVMELIAPVWVEMGYNVVIITDVQGPDDWLELPEGVTRRSIPNAGVSKPYAYIQRARALSDIVRDEHIDIMIYNAWNTSFLPWDMLAVKLSGAAFAIHCHSVFSMRVLLGQSYFAKMPYTFSFADGVICLSDVDRNFWGLFNANAKTVLNPIDWRSFACDGDDGQTEHDPNTILWVGRLESEKHPEEALRIFSRIHRELPDTKLLMLGRALSDDALSSLERFAEELDVGEAVEFCGFHENMTPFYRSASLFLCTSEFEGFSLSILEALAAGLPVVMYELPYLTLVQDNDAILSVPFGDADGASRQAIELLVDDGERVRIGELAEKYAQNLAGYDYREAWATIFASFGQPRGDVPLNRTERIMWDTLLHHYDLGTQRLARRSGGASNGGSSREAELIRASASFKIGQAVTWPARKLRTFVQCVKEHGWVYTSNVYLRRGK